MLRSVLLFPEFRNQSIIDEIRVQYDLLATHIRPHISLVFPFESSLSDSVVENAVKCAVAHFNLFEINLSKVSGDPVNGYVWLEITKGSEIITMIHDELYKRPEFSDYLQADIPYIPHITIGQGLSVDVARQLISQIQEKQLRFETIIESVSIEHILKNDDSDEFAQIYFKIPR